MLKCNINGVDLEVPEGTKLIEAFLKAEQKIAHYCWHPGLSVAGVCRLCMCEIEGNPRLQIACNTEVQEGMVASNQSEKVKETVRWGMDFHLINHPLDCPICDQAGECGLQEQYMEYGQYTPSMAHAKVKKRKVVSLGSKVVLDSERCILCSRCVRFTDEVTKTHELGIFNRGDKSEIGTFHDKPLENKYAVNTVDICPVGALTSKEFRFKQRVWYLKDEKTVCPGCSTGCSVKVYHNQEGLFRVKPEYDAEVNEHWMCDEGRGVFDWVNRQNRQSYSVNAENMEKPSSSELKLILTAQQTVEEYESLFEYLKSSNKKVEVYYWKNNPDKFDDFDNLLIRGDKNPNTKGLLETAVKHDITLNPFSGFDGFESFEGDIWFILPENKAVYPLYEQYVEKALKLENNLTIFAVPKVKVDKTKKNISILPLKTYFEKDGHFLNFNGLKRQLKPGPLQVSSALALNEWVSFVKSDDFGDQVDLLSKRKSEGFRKKNEMTQTGGGL